MPPGGVVAYRAAELPHWVADELWRVELDGDITERAHSLTARRGRVVERIGAWDAAAVGEFAEACLARHDELGGATNPCTAAYMAAHAAGVLAEEAGASYEEAHDAERAWQSAWLSDRLGLITVQG